MYIQTHIYVCKYVCLLQRISNLVKNVLLHTYIPREQNRFMFKQTYVEMYDFFKELLLNLVLATRVIQKVP